APIAAPLSLKARTAAPVVRSTLLSGVDDGDARAAALRPLMHGVDGHEHGRIADRGGGNAADRALGVTMPRHVGIVEHDLAPAAQLAGAIGFALHEAIDEPPLEVFRARPFRQVEAGIADGRVNAVDVERVLHHRMADAVASAGAGL